MINISVEPAARAGKGDWRDTANAWKVELERDNERLSTMFYTGSAITGEPSAFDVLYCLCADASGVSAARDFSDWCSEYGYDDDSIKALELYEQLQEAAEDLHNFLGDDYTRVVYMDEEELQEYCETP